MSGLKKLRSMIMEEMSFSIKGLRESMIQAVIHRMTEMFSAPEYEKGIPQKDINAMLKSKSWRKFAGGAKNLRSAWTEFSDPETGHATKKYDKWQLLQARTSKELKTEEIQDSPVIAKMRDIVDKNQAKKIKGMMVDRFTASMVIQIYDALNDSNKKGFGKMPLPKMVDVGWKLANKYMKRTGTEIKEHLILERKYEKIKKYEKNLRKILIMKGEDKVKNLIGFFTSGEGEVAIDGKKLYVKGIRPRDQHIISLHLRKGTGFRKNNITFE
jgi:hypothetical protein